VEKHTSTARKNRVSAHEYFLMKFGRHIENRFILLPGKFKKCSNMPSILMHLQNRNESLKPYKNHW
jgi:hypothetical protein